MSEWFGAGSAERAEHPNCTQAMMHGLHKSIINDPFRLIDSIHLHCRVRGAQQARDTSAESHVCVMAAKNPTHVKLIPCSTLRQALHGQPNITNPPTHPDTKA